MLFQPKDQSSPIKRPAVATENLIHSWRGLEVQNLSKKIYRYGHTSTLLGDNMIIIGGTMHGLTKEDFTCLSFNLKTNVCEEIPVTGRDSRHLYYHSACYWKDNKFIVFGGCERTSTQFFKLAILTLSEKNKEGKQTVKWEKVETEKQLTRYHHTAHIYQDKMFVIGGLDEKNNPVKDIWYLDLKTWQWHKPADWDSSSSSKIPKDGLHSHSSFLFENKVYVFASTSKRNAWSIFLVLNLDTLTWENLNSERFPAMIRNSRCSQPVNGHVYIFGADGNSFPPTQLWSYDIRQNLWFEIDQKGKSLTMRKEFTITEHKDQLYVFGGWNQPPQPEDRPEIPPQGCPGLWAFAFNEGAFDDDSDEQESQGLLNLNQIMKKLLKDSPYSDIVFEVESKEIPAHKWFLIKNSKYFANMFSSGMIESKTSKIPIPDMKAKTFESFLEFLYSDDVKLNKDLALELLEVSDKYSVPDLRVKCEEYLVKNMDVNNYVRIAILADLLDSVTLRKAAIDYMAKNIKQLKSRPEFGEISDDYIRDIIIKLTVK